MKPKTYFEWLYDKICEDRFAEGISYRALLWTLYKTEFTWTIPKDENRALDGLSLRHQYIYEMDAYEDDVPNTPCSVLEMMFALAIRCERDIMDNPIVGNRTTQWFWNMIINLGFGAMYDNNFDEEYVNDGISRLLNREYNSDGSGGLFTVRNTDEDLRKVEIWYQMCWYLDRYLY